MFANTAKEKLLGIQLEYLFNDVYTISKSQTLTIDDRMKILQEVQKKIPQVLRLMVIVKTEQINR